MEQFANLGVTVKKITFREKNIDDLAAEAGVRNIIREESPDGVDTIDRKELDDSTITFDKNHVVWKTEDNLSFNCLYLSEDGSDFDKDEIEDIRAL